MDQFTYSATKRQRGYYGKLKRGHDTLKQPVFGIFERRRSRFYTDIVLNYEKKTLQGVIFVK